MEVKMQTYITGLLSRMSSGNVFNDEGLKGGFLDNWNKILIPNKKKWEL